MSEDVVARERLEAHEELCEHRQGQILKRLDRLESIFITACGTIIVALASIAYSMSTIAAKVSH